ncbi:VanW family protein [Paenibacillus prosopidis]|uniref:Vancomycin resistance protein YoaR n=1 Tax=Paenibacillus prosopidis TaxID=630520 RepID=A0A368W2F7_9BACL|nr:VanW family protein [Paenibacillus prosopidis]RCW48844.1 vancomycin resistance protein YoaR [Paenibacillus prosopidis]
MSVHWVLAVLLLFQQAGVTDPLVVEQQGQTIAELKRSEYTLPLPGVPLVDNDKINKLMDDMDKRIHRAPINAALDGGGRIIPEKTGSRLDRRSFTEQLYSYIFEGGFSRMEVPLLPIYPKVDSELLASIKVKKIGQYFTYYNIRNKNRSHNIGLAAKAINNYVVFPGEMFSFNEVVGKRTDDRGYLRAPVIVRGEVSEGVGGGICQISSTLFNAVDRAGLHIIQRYSHSRNVPYVPPGRDATVSWYGPDFVFQNKYNQPILIRAFAQGGQVSIVICSSDVINDKPRMVPSASKKLPEEVRSEMNVSGLEP